jgi:hypothetical protein
MAGANKKMCKTAHLMKFLLDYADSKAICTGNAHIFTTNWRVPVVGQFRTIFDFGREKDRRHIMDIRIDLRSVNLHRVTED